MDGDDYRMICIELLIKIYSLQVESQIIRNGKIE